MKCATSLRACISTSSTLLPRCHAATLARVIRRHWMIENGLHWVLDVTFNQDRTQCRNADFLAGVTEIRKIIFNLISKGQSVQEAETGR